MSRLSSSRLPLCLLAALPALPAEAAPQNGNAAISRPVSQGFTGFTPRLPEPASPPHAPSAAPEAGHQPPQPAAPDKLSDHPLIPVLRGLVFERAEDPSAPDPVPGRRPVTAKNLPLLDDHDFRQSVTRWLGKPASARTFYEIGQQVTARFRTKGHPFLTVTVPPQRVRNGVLHVVVTEYRLGRITIGGNRWFSDRIIREASNLRPGRVPVLQKLQADLAWMNGNPFRTVDMIYHTGREPGTRDVELQVSDRFPVYFFSSVNNQADPTLGRLNWSVGATWGNAFGIDHTVSYQYTRSFSGRYNMHLGSWEIPLPWRDKILLFGTYSTSAPAANWPVRNSGTSGQVSIRYVHQLPHATLTEGIGLDTILHAGFDWKTTNSDQFYVATPVMLGNADTDQFVAGADMTEHDGYGQTHLLDEVFYGPGGLTHYDTRRSYQTIFQSARPEYVYNRVQISRTTNLPYGFVSQTTATAQATTHNLLYSEQLASGGIGSVRGYYVNAALGSRGEQFSEEIQLPSFSVTKHLGLGSNFADTETIGGFYDWGQTWNRRTSFTTSGKTGVASMGIDLNTKVNRIVNIVFDTGWRLRRAPDSGKRGAFCDFNIVVGL